MHALTQVINQIGSSEAYAPECILPLVYDDLHRRAVIQMSREAAGQTLQPTALLHEAWLRLVSGERRRWQNRAHFYAAAAEAMRRILIENARKKARLRHGGAQQRVNIDGIELADTTPDEKILLINDALEQLERVDREKARVVLLKFFGGHTNKEVADCLGVTERTVERQWAFAKAWLYGTISSSL